MCVQDVGSHVWCPLMLPCHHALPQILHKGQRAHRTPLCVGHANAHLWCLLVVGAVGRAGTYP